MNELIFTQLLISWLLTVHPRHKNEVLIIYSHIEILPPQSLHRNVSIACRQRRKFVLNLMQYNFKVE